MRKDRTPLLILSSPVLSLSIFLTFFISTLASSVSTASAKQCASLFQPYFETSPTLDPHATEFIVLHFDTGSGRNIPMTAHLLSSTFDANSSYLTLSLSRGGWGHFNKFAVFSRIRPHLARAIIVDPISTVSRSEIRWVELVAARNARAPKPTSEVEYIGRLPSGVLVRVLTVIEK